MLGQPSGSPAASRTGWRELLLRCVLGGAGRIEQLLQRDQRFSRPSWTHAGAPSGTETTQGNGCTQKTQTHRSLLEIIKKCTHDNGLSNCMYLGCDHLSGPPEIKGLEAQL